jgi:TolA-binding protein
LKLGLSYYNLDDNTQALSNYQKLIELYPQSTEADEALENIKNIYVELGKPNEYVALMRKNGKSISTSEADGLTYAAAELKYNNNDCAGAIAGFDNYLNEFAEGKFVLEANFYRSECLVKSKEWNKALVGYNFINDKGLNKFFRYYSC